VLDLGCGDGALLEYLARRKQVKGRGIELSEPACWPACAAG
jgi:cyclopropane fatty-acyl-phospholipid synthase-like methyltransferase